VNQTLGVGLIGLGWVSSQYIKSFRRNRHCEIRAACVRDRGRGTAALREHGLDSCRVYTEVEELCAQKDIDIVCVLTPNHLHARQAALCAEAGKHLMIEKPAALNLAEARTLDESLRRHGVKNIIGFVLRWNSLFKNISELLRRGVLGTVFHIEIDYMFHLDRSLKCFDWCAKRQTGGSVLIQSGCHAVDGICYFSGKRVSEVLAISSRNRREFDHDTTYAVLLRFEDGTTGRLFCSYDTVHPYVYDINIYGSRGSVRKNLVHAKDLFPGQIDWVSVPSVMPDTENVEHHPFPEMVDYFVDCVRNDVLPVPSVEDGMHVFEIIDAAERSARAGGKPAAIGGGKSP
jgi:predicted dehydrogenase